MREEGELRAGRCVRRERAREMRSGKEGGEGIKGSGWRRQAGEGTGCRRRRWRREAEKVRRRGLGTMEEGAR